MLVKLIVDIKLGITMHQCQAIQRLEYGQMITKAHKTHKIRKCCLWGLEIFRLSLPPAITKEIVKIKHNRPRSGNFTGRNKQKEMFNILDTECEFFATGLPAEL